MKLSTMTFGSTLLATLLVGMMAGSIRTTAAAQNDVVSEMGEFHALGDWDVEAFDMFPFGPDHDHGRGLSFTTVEECADRGFPLSFCSCVLIDGNQPDLCYQCGSALVASQFSTTNTQGFANWLTEDSVASLPQTGFYKGPDAITEYVNFIYSFFFDAYETLEGPAVKWIANPNFASDGTCIVSFAAKRRTTFNQDFYDDSCIEFANGATITFQPTDAANGYIDIVTMYFWYPVDVVEEVVAGMLPEPTINWLCGVIEEYCPETWTLNNFDNNENKCMVNYLSLPPVEGPYNALDGKSLGCKVLHAAFVPLNPTHCAHTSFKKQEDANGNVKCQKSDFPEGLFTAEQLDFFAFAGEYLFGYEGGKLYEVNPPTCAGSE